ncbi:MAG: hypothetical protein V3T33_06095 [Myxococcota bacterium]
MFLLSLTWLAGACHNRPRAILLSDDLLLRVQRARGLSFVSPVSVRRLQQGQIRSVIAEEIDRTYSPGELARVARAWASLGMLPLGTDLREVLLHFSGDAVAGFYAPLQGHLYVTRPPSGSPTARALFEQLLVHELTHALQDLHSELVNVVLGLRDQDDLSFALGALLEGDALFTERRDAQLRGEQAPPDALELSRMFNSASAAAQFPDTPRSVREPFVLQYPLGYTLVEGLVSSASVAPLDAALLDPPLSSEQLLHPEKYLHGEARDLPHFLRFPDQVTAPEPGCREIRRTTLGELGVRIWLTERLETLLAPEERVDPDAIAAAAAGWAGDRVLVMSCPSGGAFAWLLRFDRESDAVAFAEHAGRAVVGLAATADLAGQVGVERENVDVLLSAGLPAESRAQLRAGLRSHRFPNLEAFLEAHPEVLERARGLREASGSRTAPR